MLLVYRQYTVYGKNNIY